MRRTLTLALIALVALAAAAALAGCSLQKQAVENTTGNIDVAKDASVKTQLLQIDTGIKGYIASTGALPPDASQATLGSFVAPWPVNPFTKTAMKPGDSPGDYTYTPGAGTSYTLSVKLSDGTTSTAQ